MLFKKKMEVKKISYDRENEIPVVKSSICTGEKVAGFKDKNTGKFREIQLIKNDKELEGFMKMCDITQIKTEY
ncbi:MAG: aspartate dehydrogenase [Lachnospiraceae bacterium]|nr:aspartate dehydrogenase [Lachnospiraceae bacterium]